MKKNKSNTKWITMLEKYISIHSQLNSALRISYDDNINKIVDIYILNNLKPTIGMLLKFIGKYLPLNPI